MNNGPETRSVRQSWSAFSRRRLIATVAMLVLAAGLGGLAASSPAGPATIVFMTDFGADNDAVPICKGVIYSIDASIRIVDLTHQVRPYSILNGARFLFGASPYYPAGTIFLTVIDPGVGSARKAVVVKTKRGQYFVLPDNGLITLVEGRDGIEGCARNHQSGLDDRQGQSPPLSMDATSSRPRQPIWRAAKTGIRWARM